MSIQSMNQCLLSLFRQLMLHFESGREEDMYLDRRLLQVTDVWSRLTRFQTHHDLLRIDRTECIDHYFAFDGLNRIYYDCYGSRIELFKGLFDRVGIWEREGGREREEEAEKRESQGYHKWERDGEQWESYLLSVYIDWRKPTSKSRMRMIPTHHHFRSTLSLLVSSKLLYLTRERENEETYLPVCFNMSNILVWNTGSTASTLTPVPLWGIANTSNSPHSFCQ